MNQVIVLLLAFIACSQAFPSLPSLEKEGKSTDNEAGKIIGGEPAKKGELPYQVSVEYKQGSNSYICGGSILTKDYILTAAHCCEGSSNHKVTAGGIQITGTDSNKQERNVSKAVWPNDYTPESIPPKNDICLLKLGASLTLNDYVKAVTLPPANLNLSPGEKLIASGYGRTSSNGSPSNDLLKVIVPFVDDTTCANAYGGTGIIEPKIMLCAGGTESGGTGTCRGDSGGPLVRESDKKTIVGVTSFSTKECAAPKIPDVYAEVANYLDWIATNML